MSTLFLQNWSFYEFIFVGTDGISLRKMSLEPHEWPFELQKWISRAFKTQSLRVGSFKVRSSRGFSHIESKSRVLIYYFYLLIK